MKGVFILLGTNLGDRSDNLKKAIELLEEANVTTVRSSPVYETAPWGNPNQGWFLNMVIEVQTPSDARDLLRICLSIETKMGRRRIEKWGSRTIDVDILYYNNQQIDEGDLRIPHPGIAMRRFTLMPLNDLSPAGKHPILNLTQSEMLEVCPDELECKKVADQLSA